MKRWFRSDTLVLIAAAVMFAAVFALRFAVDNPATTITLLYVLPIALVAVRFGTVLGLTSAVLAILLYGLWEQMEDINAEPLAFITRGTTFLVLGGMLGLLADRRSYAERRSDSLFEMSLDMLAIANLDGYFIRVNPAFCNTLGYTQEELTIQPFVALIHPDDREKTIAEASRLGTADAELIAFQNRYLAKDGSYHWLEWTCQSSLREGVIYCAARDITERRKTDEAIRLARLEAIEATQLKSQFLANMSHEIRTPLNGVIGMAELLSDTDLSDEQREYVEAIGSSGHALLAVINDVLDFSRIEAGKLQIEAVDFDLRDMVEEVAGILAPQAHAKRLELVSWVEDDLPTLVSGDPNRLRQVLTNLIGNAIKFTDQGEVVVHVGLDPKSNGVRLIRFEVQDTGIGIAPDKIDKLFESFQQADASTTRQFGGTGLGLTISRQLVELMGGEIGASSEQGKGSRFWFTTQIEFAATDGEINRTELEGMRVLVVDDNETNRSLLERQLASWNMACESAPTGEKALELLERGVSDGMPFELLLLDYNMPEMDGLDLAKAVSERPALRTLRMLMLSSSPVDRDEAGKHGIGGFMTKPVRQSRLYDGIASLMHGKTAAVTEASVGARVASHEGLTALVVEDNPINQTVAARLLEKRGFEVDIAANGQEAVEKVSNSDYSIIFMDCQMPVLDGYEATAQIRESESEGDKHALIVAMTANTMKGERERCIEAGMDDHLGKPFTPDKLNHTLQRWLAVEAIDERAPAATPAVEPQVIDAAGFEQLRSDVGSDVTGQLVERFIDQSEGLIARMIRECDQGETGTVRELAHKLKGGSLNLRASEMAALSDDIEKRAADGSLEGVGGLLVQLEQSLARTSVGLRGQLERKAA